MVTHSLKEEAGDLTDKSRSPDSECSLCKDGRQEVAGAVQAAVDTPSSLGSGTHQASWPHVAHRLYHRAVPSLS